MRDTLIYCSNIEQLKQELVSNGFVEIVPKNEFINIDNKTGEKTIIVEPEYSQYTHGNSITPIKYNGAKTLALVRDNKLNLADFPSLTDLGTYEEMSANPENLTLYKSVYPYDVPQYYTDEEGIEQTYYLPEKIGVFA